MHAKFAATSVTNFCRRLLFSFSNYHLPLKKQLYLSLYNHPILIDGGRTWFWLEKSSGKKIYLISARSMWISWGNTARYWQWKSDSYSRFGITARLSRVCWLEIRGRIRARRLSMATTYGVYLVYKLAKRVEGFGPSDPPLEAAVRPSFGRDIGKRECSFYDGRKRGDGWLEIKLGIYSNGGNPYHEVEGSIRETKGLNWKSGLIVEGIEFRPED